jgi:hypothetical protein
MSDPHSSDYPETPLGVHRCECGAWVYSNELDGRCDRCAQPEPQKYTAELLRGWAWTYREVARLDREASPELREEFLAKAAEWEREADELERRVA